METSNLSAGNCHAFSVSIVIATRDSPHTIAELLHSLDQWLATRIPEYEILVVDDASRTPLVATSFPKSVTLIHLPQCIGQHRALVQGFRKAQMEWIYTQDDDMLPDFAQLESWMALALKHNISLNYGSFASSPVTHWRHLPGQIVRGAYALFANQWKQPSSLRFFRRQLVGQIPTDDIPFFLESWLLAATKEVSFTPIAMERFAGQGSRYSMKELMQLASRVLFYYTSLPFWMIMGMSLFIIGIFSPIWMLYLAFPLFSINYILIRIWGCPMGMWARRRIWGKTS